MNYGIANENIALTEYVTLLISYNKCGSTRTYFIKVLCFFWGIT